jgi:hypothetical protein
MRTSNIEPGRVSLGLTVAKILSLQMLRSI